MLGADVVVVEALRLFLGQRQDLAGSLGELVELVRHPWLSRCVQGTSGPAAAPIHHVYDSTTEWLVVPDQ